MKYLYSLSPALTSRFPLNTVEVRRNLMFLAEWMSAFSECPHSTQQNSSWVWRLRSSIQPQWPHIFDVYSAWTSDTSNPYLGAIWMNSSFNDDSPVRRCNLPRLKPLLSSAWSLLPWKPSRFSIATCLIPLAANDLQRRTTVRLLDSFSFNVIALMRALSFLDILNASCSSSLANLAL